jgi:hypothetical protein
MDKVRLDGDNLKGCITDALVNASKCWSLSKDCGDDCLTQLDGIEVMSLIYIIT